jgi:hypothetical protein
VNGALASALTFGRAFAPQVGAVAGVAILVGLSLGFYGGHRWQAGEVADAERAVEEAKTKLAEFRATLAAATSEAEREAGRRLATALQTQYERDQRITAQVDAIPSLVREILAAEFLQLRETVRAPEFDCLRRGLPAEFLDRVRRPGGSVPAADGRRDPEGR